MGGIRDQAGVARHARWRAGGGGLLLRKEGGGGELLTPLELGCPHGNRSRCNLGEERWEEQPLLALLPEESSHSGP